MQGEVDLFDNLESEIIKVVITTTAKFVRLTFMVYFS